MVFILSALWWIRIRGLWKLPDGRDWLWEKLGLVLMDRAMFSQSVQFSQFSCSAVSDSLQLHGLQDARLPCPSPTPGAHIHRVGDAIQPSHPWSSPSSPALNLSQHQGLFQEVSSSHPVAKVLSLIQYSVEGQGCVYSLLFDLRPSYGRGNEDNGDLLQKVLCTHCYIQYPWPWSRLLLTHASGQRLLDIHRQDWVSLLWGHCSFLLDLGVHKVLSVPSKNLFPQSCESSVIKSHWPQKSNSLGVLSPFVRSPDREICCRS